MLPQIGDVTTFLQTLQGLTDAFMIMFGTPDKFTVGLPGLKNLWLGFAFIANALIVTFLIIGVMQIMLARSGGKNSGLTPQALVTKFVIQAIGINTSFAFVQLLIMIENTLCMGILTFTAANTGNRVQPDGGNAVSMLLTNALGSLNDTNVSALILAIMGIVFIVVLFIVFFQSVIRLLRLNMFLVLTPLAFPLLMLEQTREYGSFILKTLIVTIFVQLLQVIAFCLMLFLVVSAFTGGAFGSPIIKLILTIGQLIAIAGIPRLLARLGLPTGGGEFNAALSAARSVLKVSRTISKRDGFSRGRSRSQKQRGSSEKQGANAGKRSAPSGRSGAQTERRANPPMRRTTRSGPQDTEPGQVNGNNGQERTPAGRSRKPGARPALRPFPARGLEPTAGSSSTDRQFTTRGSSSGSDKYDGQTRARTRWIASASRRSRERRSRRSYLKRAR